eukprot:scaffold71076_cov20-Prasinocladus_malaysianus.AAC.1
MEDCSIACAEWHKGQGATEQPLTDCPIWVSTELNVYRKSLQTLQTKLMAYAICDSSFSSMQASD